MPHIHTRRPIFRIPDNSAHDRISALFLGPKAENADRLMQYFTTVVKGQSDARKNYFPGDAVSYFDAVLVRIVTQ
jgi:hypothetical protein